MQNLMIILLQLTEHDNGILPEEVIDVSTEELEEV